MELNIRTADIPAGIADLSAHDAERVGVQSGDVVLITDVLRDWKVAARARIAPSDPSFRGTIAVCEETRAATGVAEGGIVGVKAIFAPPAVEVTFLPSRPVQVVNEECLAQYLRDRAAARGDKFGFQDGKGGTIYFTLVMHLPAGDAVVIEPETRVVILSLSKP